MPANTLSWAVFVHGTGGSAPLGTDGLELRAVGNWSPTHRGPGLRLPAVANTGRGVITGIDYATGALKWPTRPAPPSPLQLNDPKLAGLHDSAGADTGRFSNGQSPDNRFSVDQDNPTIHVGQATPCASRARIPG